MRRTRPLTLVIVAVLGVAAGFALDQVLTASGRATFIPVVTLPILLIVLGVFVVLMALPIRRATRGSTGEPVNPFRAVRVAMLAQASSILGAGFAGFGVGLALFVTTRPVTPSVGSWSTVIATAVCALLLVGAGLYAEHLCTIRKDDDDEQPGGVDPGLDAHSH